MMMNSKELTTKLLQLNYCEEKAQAEKNLLLGIKTKMLQRIHVLVLLSIFIFLNFVTCSIHNQYQFNTATCIFSTPLGYLNLNALQNTNDHIRSSPKDGETYYLNICKSAYQCDSGQKNYAGKMKDQDGKCVMLGSVDPNSISISYIAPASPDAGVILEFTNGDSYFEAFTGNTVIRRVRIQLNCDASAPQNNVLNNFNFVMQAVDRDKPPQVYRTYLFEASTYYACPGTYTPPTFVQEFLGFSPFALICFLALFIIPILYVIIGSIINAAIRKKRTVLEILPNTIFWKQLPFLIKDGVLLIVLGFKLCIYKIKNRNQNSFSEEKQSLNL